MALINTKHNVVDGTPEREIDLPRPALLEKTTLKDLVKALGEEMVFNDLMSALEVKFRAKIRTLLAAKDEAGVWINSDEDIKALDLTDWKPETKVRKTAEEKLLEQADGMSPDTLKAIIAALEAKAAK